MSPNRLPVAERASEAGVSTAASSTVIPGGGELISLPSIIGPMRVTLRSLAARARLQVVSELNNPWKAGEISSPVSDESAVQRGAVNCIKTLEREGKQCDQVYISIVVCTMLGLCVYPCWYWS